MRQAEKIQRGDRFGTKWLESVRRGGVYRASGNRTRITHGGSGLVVTQPAPLPGLAIMAKIKTIDFDVLTCTFWTAGQTTTSPRSLYVARPPQLRKTGLHGQTIVYPSGQSVTYTYTNQYTRTADDGTDSETQLMTPEYYIGEIVIALPMFTGLKVGSIDVYWVDINTAGRFWAKEA